jgi:hypothetical protein
MNWCPRHNEVRIVFTSLFVLRVSFDYQERVKLYLNSKSWHSVLEATGNSMDVCGMEEIRGCSSMKTIQEFNETIRFRHRLLDRYALL